MRALFRYSNSWRLLTGLIAITSLVLTVPETGLAAENAIHFADMGGIRDFQADGSSGIYIQGRNRQWYYATFFAPCHELKYRETVGFVIEPYGDFDKFSSIVVGGEQCTFKSFESVEAPEGKK